MNNLSKHISQMNTLKNKIFSISKGIKYNDHNTLQNPNVKNLTEEEKQVFIYLFEAVYFESAHLEITNISKNRIKIILITPGINKYKYDLEDLYLEKEIIRIKNIFNKIMK